MPAPTRAKRPVIEDPEIPAASIATAAEEPATTEWMAAQTFEPWDLTSLSAPSNEEWADYANPHAFMLRMALQVMGLSKAEMVKRARAAGPATVLDVLNGLEGTREFLQHWLTLVEAARTRYDSALSALVVAECPDDYPATATATATAPEPKHAVREPATQAKAPSGGDAHELNVTSAAERPSQELLESYDAWLFMERRLLALEMYPDVDLKVSQRWRHCGNAGDIWHFRGSKPWHEHPQPSSRAAMVLQAVGVISETDD